MATTSMTPGRPAASPPAALPATWVALPVAIVAISFSAIFIRLAESPPLVIAANRMLVAILLLWPAALVGFRTEIARLGRRDLLLAVGSGLFLAAHFALWTVSLDYTSVASSVVFVSTHPILVALLGAAWLGEPAGLRRWLGILLTIIGSVVIGWNDLRVGGGALLGDLLATGGAAALTGYLLIGRRLRARLSFLTYSVVVYTGCWVALAGAAVLAGTSPFAFPLGDLWWFVALALVSTLGGHTVLNWALRHLPAAAVAVTFVGEPVGASALAWLLLGEAVAPLTAIGGALILLGIYLAARES